MVTSAPVSLDQVEALLRKRYGRDYSIDRYGELIRMRKGWNRGVNLRINYDGNEKFTVTPRSYIDERGRSLVQKATGVCAILGIIVAALWASQVDFSLDGAIRERRARDIGIMTILFGLGMGGMVGFGTTFLFTLFGQTNKDEKENRAFSNQVRELVNTNL